MEIVDRQQIVNIIAKNLIANVDGVEAADLAMGEIQKPIWASEDLKAGLASFRANGPGLATFEGK